MDWTDWVRAAAALASTLAILGLGAYAARRWGLPTPRTSPHRRLKVVERLALDPRRQVLLLSWDGEEHLLLLSPFGDRPIARSETAKPPSSEAAP